MDYMIEVLMLLAVFATNILKPISKVLEDYDGLMSLAELIVEGLFLFFVLKEFKMARKSFEWMDKDRKEKREKDIMKKLGYFAWIVSHDYIMKLTQLLGKHDEEAIRPMTSQDYIDDYCKIVSEKCSLPISFCKDIIEMILFNAYQQSLTPKEKTYDVRIFHSILTQSANSFLFGNFAPTFSNLSKHFKSDDEIDAIYEKLINIKP